MREMFRPIPAATAETNRFWEGGMLGILQLPECGTCHRIFYPPPARCPDCLSSELVWKVLSGRARLRGWTDNYVARFIGQASPVCIAQCALEEDDRAVLTLIDPTGSVRCSAAGSQVQIGFGKDVNGCCYPEVQMLAG